MIVNIDRILGALSLIFAAIFVALGFLEESETIYLVVSVLYLVFAVISLFFRVRQNSIQKGQEERLAKTDARGQGDGFPAGKGGGSPVSLEQTENSYPKSPHKTE